MKEHVLVVTDIEDNDLLSLEKARDITLPMNPTLEIIKFIQHSDSELSLEEHIAAAKQTLSANIKHVFGEEADINSDVIVSDNISQWVVDYCAKQVIDLVIKGGHRSESLFHTSSDWKLIRQLHCPILIASHEKWRSQANILLALDFSTDHSIHQQLNSQILNWGERLSKVTHNALHAVYSIPIAKPLLEFDVVNKEAVKLKKSPIAKELMKKFIDKYASVEVSTHITAGPPDRTIPHEANELNSDLVIIGCVDHGDVARFFSGNVAEKALHHLRTDCLIIKLADH